MSLTSNLIAIAPPWLKRTNGAKLLRMLAGPLDAERQATREALDARFPGRGPLSSLSYVGADRLIDRGRFDTDLGYASTLRTAFDLHASAGSWWAVGNSVQRFWGAYATDADGSPVYVEVEIVNALGTRWDYFDRKGAWSAHRIYGGPVPMGVRNWNWDGDYPENRFWVIVRGLDLMPVVDTETWTIGDGTVIGDGHYIGGIAGALAADLRRPIKRWKSAKSICAGIIFAPKLTGSNDPLHWSNPPGPTMPNGTWNVTPNRDPRAAYLDGVR